MENISEMSSILNMLSVREELWPSEYKTARDGMHQCLLSLGHKAPEAFYNSGEIARVWVREQSIVQVWACFASDEVYKNLLIELIQNY